MNWLKVYGTDSGDIFETGRVNLAQVVSLAVAGSGTSWHVIANPVVGGSVRVSDSDYSARSDAASAMDYMLLNGN